MTLMVTLAERWLADVGFGDSFREPLRLDAREPQIQGDDAFTIEETETHLLMSRRQGDGDWQPQYRFTLEPYGFADFDEMCRYHQTSPQSHFTQRRQDAKHRKIKIGHYLLALVPKSKRLLQVASAPPHN